MSRLDPDTILSLMAKFRADSAPHKVDLGVGVFRDISGNTPVLECVRRAEREVLATQSTKTYVGAAGRDEFNAAAEELVLGSSASVRAERRARTVQAPGGCGALRLGAELIRAAAPMVTVHVSDPTWGNHLPLLGNSGLRIERYPYYHAPSHELRFAAMLERLDRAAAGDVVLVHACCHNPTGADLALDQWQGLIEVMQRRRLVPFLDLAYQGFGADLTADVAGVRLVAEQMPEVLIATSFSKNLGLYRERVGALIVISDGVAAADVVHSHLLQIARGIYSMPPDHGAAIAARVFSDDGLRASWVAELAAMRGRITDMRALLASELRKATGDDSFDFIGRQHGMFSLLGVARDVVDRLRVHHHIYMLGDSRMNLAGIMPSNAAYVASSIVSARSELSEPA